MRKLITTVISVFLAGSLSIVQSATNGVVKEISAGELSVKTLPIKGMKKITLSNGEVTYMSSDGRFLFKGTLVDLWTGNNIEQLEVHAVGDWKETGISPDKISVTFGDESGEAIQIFVAPECGSCLELARELVKNPPRGKKVQFILLSSSSDGTLINSNIWCSANRQQAFESNFINGETVKEVSSCNTMALMTANAVARFHHISQLPAILDSKQQIATGSVEELLSFANY